VRNIESAIEDTVEDEDEQVQESAGEDLGLDTNTLQESNKIVHSFRGSLYWLNI
jgi:hypothetical protein